MTVSQSQTLRSGGGVAIFNAATYAARALAAVFSRSSRLLLAMLCLFLTTANCFAQQTATAAPVNNLWLQTANFIVQPYVTIGLLVAGCLLLFHDLLTPLTWGVTGTLGVICMGLVFAAFITIGDRGWVGEILLLLGLAAILLEIHVFPGYGSALVGFVLMFAGMFLCLGGTREPAFALSITSFLIAVSGLAFLAYLPKSPAWKRLRVQLQQQSLLHSSGMPIGSTFLTQLSEEERSAVFTTVLTGQTGRTVTALRPIGEAEFNGVHVPVVTEGDFLSAGTPVIVTEVEGNRIVVAGVAETIHQTA